MAALSRTLGLMAILASGSLLGAHSPATGFTLVTAAEYRQLQTGKPGDTRFKKLANEAKSLDLDAPQIMVQSPDPKAAIHPPLRLDVQFKPAPTAQIDVSSFQVIYKYGPLRKDITDRILPFVKVTPEGVSGASSVAVPAGDHTLIIRVRDNSESHRRTNSDLPRLLTRWCRNS